MKVRGEITEEDYVRSQWLHMKPRRMIRIAGYLVFSLFCIAFFAVLIASDSSANPVPIMEVLILVVSVFLFWRILHWYFRRIYRNQPSLQGSHSYEFNDAGLAAESPLGKGEVSWEAFTKWREDSKLILLYQADNLFHLIPKRWFDAASIPIEDFRTLLHNRSLRCIDELKH